MKIKTVDISGFGGPTHPYEQCCQRMLQRALKYMEQNAEAWPAGVPLKVWLGDPELDLANPELEVNKFTKAISGDDMPSGAQMHTVIGHALFIRHHGREHWLEQFNDDKERIFEIEV